MPRALFLSPHLDDAAFSAGGALAALLDAGWSVDLVTVFTASVPNPTGFALACQTDKGLPPSADYLAIRRAEDFDAAAALGLSRGYIHHLPLPEAPHRGYTSAADLFAGVHADDAATAGRVAGVIAPFVASAVRVYAPRCLGNHVDHLLVDAGLRLALDAIAPDARPAVWRWRDAPYVLRDGLADPGPPPTEAVDISTTLPRKLDACCAYRTQLGFQFGGIEETRRRLRDLAESDARAAGLPPGTLAERFHPSDL